jgi:histidinol phosphatase-like PHP family hydrolase
MASIEIIIRDDKGRLLGTKHYDDQEFDIGSGSFHEIEGAVETLKQKALPQIERTLLEHQQSRFSQALKKGRQTWLGP